MSDRLLLEVRFDEVPVAFVRDRMRRLAERLFEALTSRGVGPRAVRTGFSTRRMVAILEGLPDQEPDRESWILGPPVEEARAEEGEPTASLLEFCEDQGLDPEGLEVHHTLEGDRLGCRTIHEGRPIREVLVETVQKVLDEIDPLPEETWGEGCEGWARPLRGLVALHGPDILPVHLHDCRAGRETVVHPIVAPGRVAVDGVDAYLDLFRSDGVEPLFRPRREALEARVREAAESAGGTVEPSSRDLDRLAARCEHANVLVATLPSLPDEMSEELLAHALVERLDGFLVRGSSGQKPCFVMTLDRSDDPGGRTQRMAEWAARAVVADVGFFRGADRKVTLAERARLLGDHPWAEVAGSWADKQSRIERLAASLAEQIGLETESREIVREAAGLSKVDRTTELVVHLPALRGTVGGLYAQEEGYSGPVCRVLREHYLPDPPGGELPSSVEARVLGLADRLDTLVGVLGTTSGRLEAERRREIRQLGRGAMRLLVESEFEVDLALLLARAALLWQDRWGPEPETLVDNVRRFLDDRLRQNLGERGVPADMAEAVLAVDARNPVDVVRRAEALVEVRDEGILGALVVAAKRIAGLVADADDDPVDPAALVEPAEVELHQALKDASGALEDAASEGRYADQLRALRTLVSPLDRFLAEVHVMDEDPSVRTNRTALLQTLRRRFRRVARLEELADPP